MFDCKCYVFITDIHLPFFRISTKRLIHNDVSSGLIFFPLDPQYDLAAQQPIDLQQILSLAQKFMYFSSLIWSAKKCIWNHW